jgi:multidrug transporter EmrE-like cation transporter
MFSETAIAWGLVGLAAVNNAIGSLLLKKSRLVATDPGLLSLLFSPWFLAGLLFYATNVVIFAKALDKLPVSIAYPVLAGTGFGLIAIAGSFFFAERLGLNQWLGMGLILAGVIIVSAKA